MKKQISIKYITFVICILCLTVLSPARARADTSGTCGDNAVWSLDSDGSLVISGTGEMQNYMENSPAPWGTGVRTVYISYGVTSIGDQAFRGCSKLTSISYPLSVTEIGVGAFMDCTGLQNFYFYSGVNTVKNYAFYGCSGLQTITIPSTLTDIGYNPFSGCTGLERIIVESGNSSYLAGSQENAIISKNGELISGCKNTVLSSNVKSLARAAFSGCTGLKSITIPVGVTGVGDYAFFNCTGLEEVVMPVSVTELGNYVFSQCGSMKRITIPAEVSSIGKEIFWGCPDSLYVIAPAGSVAASYAVDGGVHTVGSASEIPSETASPMPTGTSAPSITENDGWKVTAPAKLPTNVKNKCVSTGSAENIGVTYSSSDTRVLRVKESGQLIPVACGTAVITAVRQMPGAQTQTSSVTVTVIPANVKKMKVKAAGHGLVRINWKKQNDSTAFCEIQISTSSRFSYVQTAKPYPTLKKGTFLGKGLHRKKTYYVHMRVVQKDISGKTVKGNWTAVRRVKIK